MDARKVLCITDELNTAHSLIVTGFGELQQINFGNDFYHLPQQLLASGFERLLKCYLCLVYEARNGTFPNTRFLKSLGHDLNVLREKFASDYFDHRNVPLMISDREFVRNDQVLARIVHILSAFGEKARYYNLDIVTGSQQLPIDPDREWEALERDIEDPKPYYPGGLNEAQYRDYFPIVHSTIIGRLEQFYRAVAMQFTRGDHGGRLCQLSPCNGKFAALRDFALGATDYRRNLDDKKDRDTWNKRERQEILAGDWPSQVVSREKFSGEWPFRADEVVLECREGTFCIVNINGFDFGLNGSALSRFRYPAPHDAGMAILGKSIGPFIEMAFALARSAASDEG